MKTTRLLLPAIIFFISLVSCKQEKTESAAKPLPGVQTIRVHRSNLSIPVNCSGILRTKSESKLSFKTGGIIRGIQCDEGQSVKKGQLLAELNLDEIRSQVRQTELAVEKSKRDFERAGNLYRDSVATLEQFENARTALELARTQARIAGFNLRYSSIHAPADGKILKRLAEENEIIAPGYPVFLFASIQSDWVVRTNLTDRDVIRVQMLDSVIVFLDAYPGRQFMGMVSEIGTSADPYTGTYEVEVQLVRKPEKLVSGFFARLRIYPLEGSSGILIPYESLFAGNGLSGSVYVIRDGRAITRSIRIERFLDEGIVVAEGLMEGEEIVVEGVRNLEDGSEVLLLN